MASWADEISAIIEKNIAGFGGTATETASVGTVIAVQDGIARVYGLQDVKYLELVEFPRTGIMGLAFNLEEETVSCPIWVIIHILEKTTKCVPPAALSRSLLAMH